MGSANIAGVIGVCVALGCGARTPLAGEPADGGAAGPSECGHARIERRASEVLLVIDRSGSMAYDLAGGTAGPSRWRLMEDALATALPPYQDVLALGAAFYPSDMSCGRPGFVAVEPLRGNAGAIRTAVARAYPMGLTPTHDALWFTGRYLLERRTMDRARTMVLVTDGGPNCNYALQGPCVCTLAPGTGATCDGSRELCFDTDRAVALVRDLERRGVTTYVVGIADTSRSEYAAALDAMAVAGGRPTLGAGGERFHPVRRREDLARVFDAIQQQIASCSFTVGGDVPLDALRIELAGAPVARDAGRRDGWDWTDAAARELTFFGATCARLGATRAVPAARYDCARDE